jgi:hypothetical protein
MRCFYVLVHGRLTWGGETSQVGGDPSVVRPDGFFCHRYVLASDQDVARVLAFSRVRENLEKQTGWITRGLADLDLDAEEVTPAPMHKLLKPDNRGHSFYLED